MVLVDMEMPKSCEECYLKGEMDLCKALTKYYNADSIPKDCPIKAKIPDNATNGDVVKTLFPQIKTKELREAEVLCIHNTLSASCDLSWWNAPYKVLDGATTVVEATENNNDYTWAKELIKRTGLSIAPEDGSKPYGYDCEDKVWRSDVIDLFGHGSTYTSEEAQKMIKNLPSAEVEDLK